MSTGSSKNTCNQALLQVSSDPFCLLQDPGGRRVQEFRQDQGKSHTHIFQPIVIQVTPTCARWRVIHSPHIDEKHLVPMCSDGAVSVMNHKLVLEHRQTQWPWMAVSWDVNHIGKMRATPLSLSRPSYCFLHRPSRPTSRRRRSTTFFPLGSFAVGFNHVSNLAITNSLLSKLFFFSSFLPEFLLESN